MLSNLTPTDVAFVFSGVMQAVAAALWLISSALIGDSARPVRHWAGFAGLSALSFIFLVAALHTADSLAAELLRAAGNLSIVLSLSLHAMLLLLVVTRLLADLRRFSRHDGLTGLLNRRALEEALGAQLQRSRRSGEPFCVLMLDVDHFKRINDEWGHPVGDLALKHLSALLRGHMREIDQIGRFGGEEFLLLLPGLTAAAALPVAERLRELLAAAPLLHGQENTPMSISIGMAQWAGTAEDGSRLLVRADAALYRAKRHGRNRVVAADADAALA